MTSTPLMNLPISVLMDQLVYPNRQGDIGKRYRIAHLTSEAGKKLNGNMCTVVGFDRDTKDARLHSRVENDSNEESIKRLKQTNLVRLEAAVLGHNMPNTSPITNDELAECLKKAIRKHTPTATDRVGFAHQLGLYQDLLDKLRTNKSVLTDADYCFPCGAGGNIGGTEDRFSLTMTLMKPACVGSNVMDLGYTDTGLKGDDHTVCSICNDVFAEQDG